MSKPIKILYFGGNRSIKSIIGLHQLTAIYESDNIYVVIDNRIKVEKQRKSIKLKIYNFLFNNYEPKLPYENLISLCKEKKIRYLVTKTPRSQNITIEIKNFAPDFLISNGWGWIINDEWIKLPKFKSLNCHSSLLPKYKGPSTYKHALMNFEKKTGLTVHELTPKIDEGDIYAQKEVEIKKNDVPNYLLFKLASISGEIIQEAIENVIAKKVIKKASNEGFFVSKINAITYAKNRTKNRIRLLLGRKAIKYNIKK